MGGGGKHQLNTFYSLAVDSRPEVRIVCGLIPTVLHICFFNKHLWSTYCVPGTLRGMGVTVVNKGEKKKVLPYRQLTFE